MGAAPRASVEVAFQVAQEGGNTASADVRRALNLAGPEDVRGLNERVVRRTWPRAEVLDAEPNLLPLVEFAQCDLPWRFTPEVPSRGSTPADVPTGQLRPWICLVVLEEEEFRITPASDRQPFTKLEVTAPAALPPLEESWAWAHVQYVGAAALTAPSTELRDHPERFVARLLCPRRLRARRVYHGFVVPVFLRGARAGLGEAVLPGTPAAALAWSAAGTTPVTLPVYYQWRFGTGAEGDFEALVRALRPRPLPDSVGTRAMTVAVPELGSLRGPVLLEAALQPLTGTRSGWVGETPETPEERSDPSLIGARVEARRAFSNALRDVLDRPALELERPSPAGWQRRPVVPPIYGQWHALRDRLGALPAGDFDQAGWLLALNADPRHRAAAAMGTRVVQKLQQSLMASAWAQLGRVQTINEALRQAQLGRDASRCTHARWLAPLGGSAEAVVFFTTAVHGTVMCSNTTVRSALHRSPIDRGLLDPAWRRLSRRGGALGRRQGRGADRRPVSLLARMNAGIVRPEQAVHTPSGAATPATVGEVRGASLPMTFLGMVASLPFEATGQPMSPAWGALREAVKEGKVDTRDDLLPRLLSEEPLPSRFRVYPEVPASDPQAVAGLPDAGEDAARGFDEATRELFTVLGRAAAPGETLVPVNLGAVADALLAALDPERAVTDAMLRRLTFSPRLRRPSSDPLAPVMASPEFEQPMYAPLRALSQEWILPGLDAVPTHTATAVQTNRRFLEAYMVGLNHEMARELLWHGYPTDQRGSYFRQFWEPVGEPDAQGGTSNPTALLDLRAIDTWAADSRLGEHPVRVGDENKVVLLLRSELLRRYPSTVVYVAQGSPDRGPGATAQRTSPLFVGALPPDVTFLGFDLTAAQLRAVEYGPAVGGVTQPLQWFFVFEEQVVEFRFGLDESAAGECPVTPDDLAWSHLGVEPGAVVRVRAAGASARALEGVMRDDLRMTGLGSEKVAKALFQRRVKVAVPAACMVR